MIKLISKIKTINNYNKIMIIKKTKIINIIKIIKTTKKIMIIKIIKTTNLSKKLSINNNIIFNYDLIIIYYN